MGNQFSFRAPWASCCAGHRLGRVALTSTGTDPEDCTWGVWPALTCARASVWYGVQCKQCSWADLNKSAQMNDGSRCGKVACTWCCLIDRLYYPFFVALRGRHCVALLILLCVYVRPLAANRGTVNVQRPATRRLLMVTLSKGVVDIQIRDAWFSIVLISLIFINFY